MSDLERFLVGRLRTVGLVAAAFAAAACRASFDVPAGDGRERVLAMLDLELDARTPSPAQRKTSRQLGRQLVRALSAIVPDAPLADLGRAPHQPLALGAGYAAVGLGPHEAALASLHEAAAGPVAASVRLLSTDPFETHGVFARLTPLVDALGAEAVDRSADVRELPASAGLLLDTHAERHRIAPTRLFAS